MSTRRSKNVALEGHRKKRNSLFIAILFAFTLFLAGGGEWTATLQVGSASAQGYATPDVPTAPTIGGTGDLQTVPFMLNLPAGVNLVSAPLDAGPGPAIGAFEGIEPDWPYFFQWDASSQRFLGPKDSMLAPGAGYWYYTPAPTTLLIHGEPYPVLKHLTKDITPGWHLIGVPFIEGIDWSGFHLYHGSNPVGIETARKLGWISSDVLTMQGSRWHKHETGTPFEPGLAYWIKTTVPLSLRAEPSAAAPPGGLLTAAQWEMLYEIHQDLVATGKDIIAGQMTRGGFSASGAAGAVFGLANMIVQKYRYDTIMDDVNSMSDKFDELLVDVGAIQNQLAAMQAQIESLQNWLSNDTRLGQPLSNAEAWIAQYFSDPTHPLQSYNWALWQMAGCAISAGTCVSSACVGGPNPGSVCTTDENCFSCTNPVTDASAQTFNTKYVQNPATRLPTLSTDNFYLWWAYSVLGGQAEGIEPYKQNGNTADNLVQSLHDGMVNPDPATLKNGLRSYMEFVFNNSPACATDVTTCDLYSQVYLQVEAYFQQLIAIQLMLAQAMVEAYTVLASTDQTTHSHDTDVSDYMTGIQQKLSDEAEAFVGVAEQIALYRAADGRFDWSSFGTSDAAQLLARADFVAAQLVGSPTGKPWPWPPGVTGRIFYTEQQTVPTSTTVHSACQDTTNCATLTEAVPVPKDLACQHDPNYADQCVLKSNWPYLQWHLNADSVAIGEPTTTWKLRRLVSQPLAAGTYQVASVNAQYGNSKLVVAEYGSDYTNPPADPTKTVLFGSFNNVEGKLGIGALGANRTYSTSFSPNSAGHLHSFTTTPSTNYTQVTVAYNTADDYGAGDWYEKMKINIPSNPTFNTYPRVRLFWPSTVETALGEYSIPSGSDCSSHYYQKVEQSLRLIEADGDYKPGAGQLFDPCGTNAFGSCRFSNQDDRNGSTMLVSDIVTLRHGDTYTLRAHFSDNIYGYYQYQPKTGLSCQKGPTSGSHFTWKVFNPTITLVK